VHLQSSTASNPPVLPSPVQPACARWIVPGLRVRLSWGSCSHRNATTSGAPARPSGREAVWEDEGRQTSVGAVLRVLAPLDGFGCPTLRGLITYRSRFFGAALQSFPFPRSRARSREPLLPCRFASDRRQRDEKESFTTAFAFAQALCLAYARRRTRRMSFDEGFPRSLGRSLGHALAQPRRPTISFPPGSPVNGQHARFEALLPSGVRSPPTSYPGQGGEVKSAGALLGIFPRKLAPYTIPGSVSRADSRERGQAPTSCISVSSAVSLRSRDRAPTLRF